MHALVRRGEAANQAQAGCAAAGLERKYLLNT